MREIEAAVISEAVETLCIDANYDLPEDVLAALVDAEGREESPLGKTILSDIVKNAGIAARDRVPICQDTGLAVFFVELGQEVHIVGGSFREAMDEGVKRGYQNGYLRKSTVEDPFLHRKNRGDNTPAIVHLSIVPGDQIKITIAPKGGGSENMSALAMLKPSDGVEGIRRFVLDTVNKAGANPCPPIIIGIGIGGSIEKTTLMAKHALLRPLGQHNPDPEIAAFEEELLSGVNRLGIGPQGFGGSTTALAVHIETFPAHIASMPVAINIQCHAARHLSTVI